MLDSANHCKKCTCNRGSRERSYPTVQMLSASNLQQETRNVHCKCHAWQKHSKHSSESIYPLPLLRRRACKLKAIARPMPEAIYCKRKRKKVWRSSSILRQRLGSFAKKLITSLLADDLDSGCLPLLLGIFGRSSNPQQFLAGLKQLRMPFDFLGVHQRLELHALHCLRNKFQIHSICFSTALHPEVRRQAPILLWPYMRNMENKSRNTWDIYGHDIKHETNIRRRKHEIS